jgi:tetratricopeptide (TPR) repeat protein
MPWNLLPPRNYRKFIQYFRTSGRAINLGFLVFPIIVFFMVREISDSDMWFHLAVGKQILATGSLPTFDQLSLLNYGQPVSAHLWLFQTVLAAGYPLGAGWWLQGVQVVLLSLTLFIVYRTTRRWTSPNLAWLMLLAVVIASAERFTVRPELVSFIMIALYYYRLQQGKYHSPVEIIFFFILQEIWTNSHGIFVIGPFLAGCYLAEALLKGVMGKGYKDARSLGILTAVLTAACIVTPNGWENISYAWRLFAESNPLAPQISNSTHEMAAALGEVSRTMLPFWFYFFLIVAFLVSLVATALHCRRQLPVARTMIGFALLAASMTGMKNMPLFAIVAAPLITENLSTLGNIRLHRICAAAIAAAMAIAAIVWSPRPALNYLANWAPYRFGLGLSTDYVPVGLPPFLDQIGFYGPIYNSMDQGGFYAYHNYPKRIPFYDSRLQDYKPEEIIAASEAVSRAARNPEGWHTLLRRYDFRGVLLCNTPDNREAAGLLPHLAKNAGWRLIYLDQAASFWIRVDQGNLPPPVGRTSMESLVANLNNFAQAENINFFLEKTGYYPDLRLKLLEQANRKWQNAIFLADLGLIKLKAGNTAEAEQLFLRLLRKNPESRLTLATLAQIALFKGDRAAAEKYLEKALHYYPDDAELLQNLELVQNYRKSAR